MNFETSDILAGLALVLSAIATWKTIQFNNIQKGVNESQQLLNKRLLEREESDAREAKKAELGATLVKLGHSSYRLKIWNKGKAPARNVTVEFPDGDDLHVKSDVESKFPMESLEPQQSVELIAAVGYGTKSKHAIKLVWADDYQAKNEKTVFVTN